MSKKLLIAALALACVTSLGMAGEDGRKDRPQGGPPSKEFRDQRGPRKGGDDRQRPGDRKDKKGPKDRWDDGRGHGGPRHMGGHFGPRMGMGRGMGMHKGFGGHGLGMFRDVDLTADQKTKLVDIMTNNYRQNLQLRLDMIDAQRKAFDIRKSESASSEEIITLNRQMGELRGKFEASNREIRDQLKSILTPEQAAKLEQSRDRWDRPHFRGDRRPGGPGPRHHGYDVDDDDADDMDDMDDFAD